jgi:hypothetical protein
MLCVSVMVQELCCVTVMRGIVLYGLMGVELCSVIVMGKELCRGTVMRLEFFCVWV